MNIGLPLYNIFAVHHKNLEESRVTENVNDIPLILAYPINKT